MNLIMNLKDKICIVTGAASGIGHSVAKRFVADGAKVVIADLKKDAADKTAQALMETGPGKAIGIEMDVTDKAQVDAGVEEVISYWGGVDVLVSNAGVQIVHKLEGFPFEDWKKLLSIHLDSAFLTSKACLPYMHKKGRGSIIFMGSVHSKEASPLKSAYVTAKHGLLGLARIISKDGGKKGIHANVICPGFIKTPLVEKQISEQAQDLGISEKNFVKKVILGQTMDSEFTTIEDVAEAAYLFATFPANAMAGQSLASRR